MHSRLSKPFIFIKGKPILFYTLEKFRGLSFIKEIILVLRKSNIEWVTKNWSKKLASLGVKKVVAGGKRRQDSVYNGLSITNEKCKIVMIHDAVRPFVKKEWIYSTCEKALKYGGAIVAIPIEDTVKFVINKKVKNTLNRSLIWRAQTPQAFRRDFFIKSYKKIMHQKISVTDDSQIIEIAGSSIAIVEGDKLNIKITDTCDLRLLEFILSNKQMHKKCNL